MPYIKQECRAKLDVSITKLREAIESAAGECDLAGMLNYSITQLLRPLVTRDLRYKDIMLVLGTLEAVKLEFYRRVAVPYECDKIGQNGEVYR